MGFNSAFKRLIISIWKVSSQMWVDKKMLSNDELLIVVRRQIDFDRDQKVAATHW